MVEKSKSKSRILFLLRNPHWLWLLAACNEGSGLGWNFVGFERVLT